MDQQTLYDNRTVTYVFYDIYGMMDDNNVMIDDNHQIISNYGRFV